jgi:UDP-N-acetylglucosamine/UDP-N-acetylgalactosamine 4-epimerase
MIKNLLMENKSILVTGGCGFIGSNIVEHLLKNNIKKVRILDNLSTGYLKNIKPFLVEFKNLEFMYGDIKNLEDCRKAMKGIDIVCHQAALGSVPRSLDDPLSSHNTNVNGFFNILLSAKENNIKRLVYASSSSVYGNDKNLPKEELKTGKVLSPYAATKAIDEVYGWVFSNNYGMECIGLRYFNVFGPRQDPNGAYAAVIPKFISLMKNNERPKINGNGNFSRDFTYIDNIVQGNCKAMFTQNSDCYGEVYNIGAGGRVTIFELFSSIKNIMNYKKDPLFGEERPGDIPHSNASILKATKMLDYRPEYNFDDGIKKTIDYFLNL